MVRLSTPPPIDNKKSYIKIEILNIDGTKRIIEMSSNSQISKLEITHMIEKLIEIRKEAPYYQF
jgi:hypothetical protein